MATGTQTAATFDDLMRVEGKAELIGGEIVHLMAAGDILHFVAFEIAVSLREHVKRTGVGAAFADGMGFALRPPLSNGRQSFSPDAAYTSDPRPKTMGFIFSAPTFAVEVRSENDYGPSAKTKMAAKRADYFEAGTKVVWDVDPSAETVTVYRAEAPTTPAIYRRGQEAEAEPAVPGWRTAVDAVFGG
jgi:Uma2 family endonuclease